jgi:hypothetical protein
MSSKTRRNALQNAAKSVRVAADHREYPRTAPRSAPSPSQEHRWTSAPATTSTAISTSALRPSASMTGRSTPMAGSRSRSLTLLSSVGALPSASTRSGSQRKSGAGAAPIAWRPLFIRGYRSSVAQNANISARRQAFECCAQFKPRKRSKRRNNIAGVAR